MSSQWQDDAVIEEILRTTGTIAVVGLSPKEHRDSHRVARYLQERGFQIIPVNPNAGEVLGEKSYPSLREVPGQIDLVDVFRRPEVVDAVARDAVEIGAGAIWMQIGVGNQDAARIAADAGLKVVMDRCLMVEHRRFDSDPG